MKQWKVSAIGLSFVLLILLFFLFLMRGGFREKVEITLPPLSAGEQNMQGVSENAITDVSVTPDTVQWVIETLARPDNYACIVRMERFWNGGNAETITDVHVAQGWTSLRTAEGIQIRYVLTNGETTYIWYDNSREYYQAPAVFSEDAEYGIPTYEDILLLPRDRIAAADYRAYGNTDCIYAETTEDEDGYRERYWISVAQGLPVAVEKEQEGVLIFRMEADSIESGAAQAEAFQLPDGERVWE